MRDIEYILDDLDKWAHILTGLHIEVIKDITPEEKEHFENEIEFVREKIRELQNELEEAEKEEAKRFNTANERAMSEAGHNERDFL
ncbi:hypothetical protein LD11_gp268 [Bacillus phage Riley]|uniref:Uncharacterized protein n=3 Tax=Bequatrovirus TaxID=1917990 RepID=A0A075M0J1_9CAUD|nr:hypothetical protein LD11_gp268 [Bacillus phage Riley]YP_009206632.1 hypothetical protein AVV02_gp277 [Bacillus phage AvesoBmore]ASZ76001.1 hypothetical protein TAFFO16_268 [Bacillus phage Taffo16]ULF48894.1 hypothetical protein [Bacillus phage BillyBob]AIF72144.1 hypothetical protein [Bacillus phage Riley]ALA13263.1 hypothetical protein AVESOBMORE_277 [Bacillus phage AvesoBmore]